MVHGDGPQDRVSGGGYAPLINVFLDQGIAVASWDKPGVGASGGNWLHQSMADRASETSAALSLLNQRFDDMALGAVGFSQAGWVLPQLTRRDADFLVLVGPAVSWQDQGDYYTRVRLAQDGLDPR
ncbi:alpha/beta hydrolase family protein [Phaeobacter inhibens]|uniref:alpha/beta hydrolase family protein n=1 Tax=Phaeobacter inhibens TaxID=221822 RepID=UPI0021A837D6|nr:alpha/beta hydrolase [Phaeobacter inhibens]